MVSDSEFMAPYRVLWYGDYDYNWDYIWQPGNNSSSVYDYYTDDLISYTDEDKLRNIVDQIIACDYTIEKFGNDGSEKTDPVNEPRLDDQVDAGTRNNDVAWVGSDQSVPRGPVCGISQDDLKAAMLYTKTGDPNLLL